MWCKVSNSSVLTWKYFEFQTFIMYNKYRYTFVIQPNSIRLIKYISVNRYFTQNSFAQNHKYRIDCKKMLSSWNMLFIMSLLFKEMLLSLMLIYNFMVWKIKKTQWNDLFYCLNSKKVSIFVKNKLSECDKHLRALFSLAVCC